MYFIPLFIYFQIQFSPSLEVAPCQSGSRFFFCPSQSTNFLLRRSRWDQRGARGRGHGSVFFTRAFLLLLMDEEAEQTHQLGCNNKPSGTWGGERGYILLLLKVHNSAPPLNKAGLQSNSLSLIIISRIQKTSKCEKSLPSVDATPC